jgi:hypothetical protein
MPKTISTTTSASAGITLTSGDNPVSITGTGTIVASTPSALYGPSGTANFWTIANSGLISSTGTDAAGIQLGSYNPASKPVGAGMVTNQGTIAGGAFGVSITGPGVVTNQTGGYISAANAAGTLNSAVYIVGDPSRAAGDQPGVQIVNAGTLTGPNGAFAFLGGSVTNTDGGVISGTSSVGIWLDSSGTVVNAGTVSGLYLGVDLFGGGSITNAASGYITGGSQGVYFGSNGGTFTNAGTVSGSAYAVHFSGYSGAGYRLIADPGAVFNGVIAGGKGVLELASGSSTGTLHDFGSTITNFSTLQFDKGSSWNISGDQGGLGTMSIVGLAAGDVVDLTGFAATAESFSNGTLTLTDSSNLQATLSFPDRSDITAFQFAPDGKGGTDIAGAGTGQTLTWTSSSGHDWNTATNWSPAIIPGSFDTAVIANPGSTSVTIATGATNVVGNLLINSPGNSLEVDGSLNTVGTVTIDAGSLIDAGALAASAIKDNALLATQGVQTLDNIPIELGGTLQSQAGGALTLGPSEVITQTGPTATLDSTTSGGESIINQGTIDASAPGGSLTIAPLNFTNQGTILVDNQTATIGFDQGGSLGTWDNTSGTIALSGIASLVLDGSLARRVGTR